MVLRSEGLTVRVRTGWVRESRARQRANPPPDTFVFSTLKYSWHIRPLAASWKVNDYNVISLNVSPSVSVLSKRSVLSVCPPLFIPLCVLFIRRHCFFMHQQWSCCVKGYEENVTKRLSHSWKLKVGPLLSGESICLQCALANSPDVSLQIDLNVCTKKKKNTDKKGK